MSARFRVGQVLVVFVVLLVAGLVASPGARAQDGVAASPVPARDAYLGGPYPIAVIFTNIPGDPSAAVPGLPGVMFQPGTSTTHFDRVFGSPNGNWILGAFTDQPTASDEIVLANGTTVVVEGDPAPWTGGAEDVGLIEQKLGINDTGDFVFGTNTNGPTASDEYMVLFSGGTFTAAAQEGTAVPALAGATWGSTIESGVIDVTGTVGLVSDSVGGPPTTENEIAVLGATLLAQEGVTVPAGQVGSEPWENFDINDFFISADGSHWMAQGDLTGSTVSDDVTAVDGTVVVQEDSILAGSGFVDPVDGSGIVGIFLGPGGRYFVRGNNDGTEQDWVYSDGAVIAMGGGAITTGAVELWDDTDFSDLFFLHVANTAGDFVIGGVTDAASDANGVLVLNNDKIVVRESDPIDLDGNGMFDDDTFFDTFGNDDAHLTDAGILYVVATIKNGAGTRLGQGFFSIDLTSEVPVELMRFAVE